MSLKISSHINQIKPSNLNQQNPYHLNEIENLILRSTTPIKSNITDEITILGECGIWLNKHEAINWKGDLPLDEYKINEDQNPEIILKKSKKKLTLIQELAIRYLKPPTPPTPGEIIIKQEPNIQYSPAIPLIIRQQPIRAQTPEPLVIREAPPKPPKQIGKKVIIISGKKLPPPPRKVVIERLANIPTKPQSVLIERWLPYSPVKRRVIYKKSNNIEPIVVKPKNIIVQWEAPQTILKKKIINLGVIKADPVEYVKKFGNSLKFSNELPSICSEIKHPEGVVLAADSKFNQNYELEGEIEALKLIDLDKEGLSEYKSQLNRIN